MPNAARGHDSSCSQHRNQGRVVGVAIALSVLGATLPVAHAQSTEALLETFERDVRPVLVRRCQSCHGAEKQKSGLRLDHRDFVLEGGSRGPAVLPGDVEGSLLVHAIGYGDVDLSMPPKGKLPADEIAILRSWVAGGAVWPEEPRPESNAGAKGAARVFDLEARRAAHWCWQPLPKSLPDVPETHGRAGNGEIDAFIRAKLEENGLAPAEPADRRTWIRRVTFDLTGLPPTESEIDAYLADESTRADANVVDRLLASPRHAEHFARHFLDLARFAETLGHEYDFRIANAWRYRDYVVRAIENDLPYDRFVTEHIAGDLVAPRRDAETGINEAIVATGFWWLGDQTHSPVDVRKHQADRIDNQIDVVSKAFLGVTVACARCHDHKFDAISKEDYYAFFGFLESSRYAQVPLTERGAHDLDDVVKERDALVASALDAWASRRDELARYLSASDDAVQRIAASDSELAASDAAANAKAKADGKPVDEKAAEKAAAKRKFLRRKEILADIAAESSLDVAELERFVDAAHSRPKTTTSNDPRSHRKGDFEFADFTTGESASFDGWRSAGVAFGAEPMKSGVASVDSSGDRLRLRFAAHPAARTDSVSPRLTGALYSRSFVLDKRFVHVRAAGRDSRINLTPEGFPLLRNPIWGHFKLHVNNESMRWYRIDAAKQQGLRVAFELLDQPVHDPADPFRGNGYDKRGWLGVERIVLSDDPNPPSNALATTPLDVEASVRLLDDLPGSSLGALTAASAEWLDWLGRHGLLLGGLDDQLERHRELDAAISIPPFAPVLLDESPVAHAVHLRGDHRYHGDVVEPRFLEALCSPRDSNAIATERAHGGSGRLALAGAITSRDNPLTARVFVNRAWHWFFGRGLVPTTDNFGVLGEQPTHPRLLDWLAVRFLEDDWSMRETFRRIVLSETYRMSSSPRAELEARIAQVDPDDRLLHSMPVRRLTGEAIRDAILAVSGRLDTKRFGPGVATHLTPFMDGRGRPGRSGPLDGDGRRSIWLEVRRNFLDPFFLAFDRPSPFSAFGRRSRSNVPAQALALLNDPFVQEQSRLFGERTRSEIGGDGTQVTRRRVERMFRQALAREPEPAELDDCVRFVDEHSLEAFAHVLFNLKEFVWIR
ncbi:MAG: PSD1 domain-containing protein [Planctomycetes bacterium]|nr:PSD1 domain-containing protein [Planctomycetota bacterium]